MKRAEREHLKEDPFELFITRILTLLNHYRKQITIGIITAAVLLVIFLASQFFLRQAEKKDIQLLTEGMTIINSVALNPEQKIDELKKLPLTHKGKSAALYLQLTALHIAVGDRQSARQILDDSPKFSLSLLEDQRHLLNVTLLADEGKVNEAIDLLQRLISNSTGTLNRDLLLFRLGDFQVRAGNTDAAKDNFKRLLEEFPQSMFAYRAQQSLEKLN